MGMLKTMQEQRYLQLYQENINLQEALVRESNSNQANNKKKPAGPKIPILVASTPKTK